MFGVCIIFEKVFRDRLCLAVGLDGMLTAVGKDERGFGHFKGLNAV